MHYKGKAVQWQRVRAKKGPKIQEMGQESVSPEEQKKAEEMVQQRANEMIRKDAQAARL